MFTNADVSVLETLHDVICCGRNHCNFQLSLQEQCIRILSAKIEHNMNKTVKIQIRWVIMSCQIWFFNDCPIFFDFSVKQLGQNIVLKCCIPKFFHCCCGALRVTLENILKSESNQTL